LNLSNYKPCTWLKLALTNKANRPQLENIVGYSDKLKQAFAGMKLGISNGVDLGTKNAALKLMAGGP